MQRVYADDERRRIKIVNDRISYRRDVSGWLVRWDEESARRAVAEGDWPNRTVAQYAQDRAISDPDRVLLIDNDVAVTAAEIYERASRLAGWFRDLGLEPGAVVSFQLPNWWEASVVNIAAAMTGLVVNPIVPINRDSEVSYMLAASRSRVMFIPGVFRKFDYPAMMRRILGSLSPAPVVVTVRATAEGCLNLADILIGTPLATPATVDPDAVKLLMYTSGTTGRPKGVLHSHNSINADSAKMKPVMGLGGLDITFSPSPVTHVSGYLWALNMPWYGNVPAVMIDVWDAETAFNLLKRHQCSFALGATPFLQDLVRVARERGETLEHLRYYLCGGASVPPSLIYEAADVFPNCIPWRNFGATEAPTMTAPPISRLFLRQGAETDGRIHRAEIKIIDVVTNSPVPAGEEGEILVREPSMALGYSNPDDNNAAYDDDGFFRMGDLARIVEDGLIVCTGRKKDLIIRAGENISAKEIEDVLFLSEKVADVAVVSMPSVKTGEAICAFVVPAGDDGPSFAEVTDLIGSAGLARQKTPEHVELVSELPKTAAGKVRKDLLRERARAFAAAKI